MERLSRLPTDHRKRAAQARKRLGLTKEQKELLDSSPKLAGRLREVGLSVERVVEILDADDSDDARLFLCRYETVSASDRKYLSIEEVCIASGLSTRRLWEVIAGARLEQSQEAVKLMVAESQPRIMQTAIEAATARNPILDGQGNIVGHTCGDVKATELIWKATGMLPTPKGATTIINNQQNNLPLPDDDEDGIALPEMDTVLKEIQRVTTAPQLEAPKDTEIIPNAEYEDVKNDRLSHVR